MKTKHYTINYLDNDNNVVTSKLIEAKTKKDASRIAKISLSNLSHNTIVKTVVI